VGDAAGYVEPFTGEGMAWALATAGAATPFIQQGLRVWDEALEHDWITAYRALIGRQQKVCRMLTRALRSPWAVHLTIGLLRHWPSLAQPIVTRLGAGRHAPIKMGET
jgi:flavin-dependent dehydrogenase